MPQAPMPQAQDQPEDELDALLVKVEQKKENAGSDQDDDQVDAVDIFRARLRQVYKPVFNEIAEKYASRGVILRMDADDFLGGGAGLKFKFIYGDMSMTLDGTVTRSGVAFYMIRGFGASPGTVLSGPMLRVRNLSGEEFRTFIVDHLSALIKDAIRQA